MHEIYSNIKCLDNIGFLEKDLKVRADEAFKGGENDIRLDGAYKVRVPQSIFDTNQLDFNVLFGKSFQSFHKLQKCLKWGKLQKDFSRIIYFNP